MFKAWRIDPDGIKVVADPLKDFPRYERTGYYQGSRLKAEPFLCPLASWAFLTLERPGPGLQEKSPGPLHLSVSCHPYFLPIKKKMNLP